MSLLDRRSLSVGSKNPALSSRPGYQNTDAGRFLQDADVKSVLEKLDPDRRLVAEELIKSYLSNKFLSGDTKFAKGDYLSTIVQMLDNSLIQQHNEQREDTAIDREVSAMLRNNVNPDLHGVSGSGSSPASPDSLGSAGSGSGSGVLGLNVSRFNNRVAEIKSFGDAILGVAKTAGAISTVVGPLVGSKQTGSAIESAIGQIPDLAGTLYHEGMSDEELSNAVLDAVFAEHGQFDGIFGRSKSRKFRSAVSDYLGGYMSSEAFKQKRNVLNQGTADSEKASRAAVYANEVDKASGVHDVGGAVFEAEAKALKSVALNECKAAEAEAEAKRLSAEYNRDYNGSLDADLAARAENRKHEASIASSEASISESNYKADFYGSMSGADDASRKSQSEELDLERKRRLDAVQEAQARVDKATAEGDEIVAKSRLELLDALDDEINNPAATVGHWNKRTASGDQVKRRYKASENYKRVLEADKPTQKTRKFKLNIPGVGSAEF